MDAEEARTRLQGERARLETLRQGFGGLTDESEQDSLEELSSADQHQAEMATETFQREADFSVLEQVEAELADIEHALRRLDDGSYGRCEACGKPIGDERLEALPAARFCVEDQAQAEREVRATSEE